MKNKRFGKERSFTLKLDMSKAYDRVEWRFIEEMLSKMGFSVNWVEQIMRFITPVTYSIVVNGRVGDKFTPSQGLQQGDPLSPYLFLVCGEGLSTLLRVAESNGAIKGARSHFGDATAMGASNVLKVLQSYANCSNMGNQLDVERILGVHHADNWEKYLGLPYMVDRNKKWAFNSLRDKIQSRISSWSTRLLSMGGMKKAANKRGIHWCTWSFLSNLKDDGRMGFRDLAKFNVSIGVLTKQGWRILMHPTSLMARILKAKYFPNTRFLSAQLGSNHHSFG
ncbi:reverse transcriptase [Gossypium australe]|uniref:Reverse transcriptase n=1 Tax=Gossypium australe TaxID=47621 RepID=A0A5B6WUR5_9ROSI|nr:reverse transcriptase [Gossypium australe]